MNQLLLPIFSLVLEKFRERRFIRDEVLPLVQDVNGMPDTTARRQFVIRKLMKQGLTESKARRLTEDAVEIWKKLQAKVAKKAAKAKRRKGES